MFKVYKFVEGYGWCYWGEWSDEIRANEVAMEIYRTQGYLTKVVFED